MVVLGEVTGTIIMEVLPATLVGDYMAVGEGQHGIQAQQTGLLHLQVVEMVLLELFGD
jgi:hypothetical protein